MLTRFQGGYINFCCISCKWDSRVRVKHHVVYVGHEELVWGTFSTEWKKLSTMTLFRARSNQKLWESKEQDSVT